MRFIKGISTHFRVLFIILLSFSEVIAQERQTCVTTTRNPWEWPGHNNFFLAPSIGGKSFVYNFTTQTATSYGNSTTNVIGGYEGISSASDDGGNLILMTNGLSVYDNTGTKTYAGLKEGNEGGATSYGSASQGVMMVRHPLAPFKYYALTTDDALGGANGFNIGVFDENAQHIYSKQLTTFKVAEGISATFHENGVDIWVTVLKVGSTEFHTFLLTCDGFVTPAVISNEAFSVTGQWERGGIAFNWDGTKMASAFPQAWPTGVAANTLRIYNFNNKTGEITDGESFAPTTGFIPYDLVFGADNQTLYISEILKGVSTFNTSASDILGSRQSFSMPNGSHLGLELGADGYVYSAGASGMYRINSASGGTTDMNIKSSNGISSMFIPPAEEPDITEVGPFCDTITTPIDLYTEWVCSHVDSESGIRQADATHGYFGNGIQAGDSGQIKGLFVPSDAGAGLHMIEFRFCDVNDTIWIEVKECVSCEVELDDVQPELCIGVDSIALDPIVLLGNGPGVWSIDSIPTTSGVDAVLVEQSDTSFNALNLSTKEGEYKLIYTVTGIGSTCKDSIYIVVNPLPKPDLGNDTSICKNDPSIVFDAGNWDTYLWNYNNEITRTISTDIEGEYLVEVTDIKGCKGSDTVLLKVNELPVPYIENDTICEGDSAITFDVGIYDAYSWDYQNGTGSSIKTTIAGDYKVEVTDSNGCVEDTVVTLIVNPKPVVDLGVDKTICKGDAPVTFDAGTWDLYVWNTSETNQQITKDSAGEYIVEITDQYGCKDTDSVVLFVDTLPLPFIPNDTICEGDPSIIFDAGIFASYTWSFNNSPDQTITVNSAGIYSVEVIDDNGCEGDTIVELVVNPLPQPFIDSKAICDGDSSVTFDPGNYDVYNWNNGGSNSSTFSTSSAGNYSIEVTDSNGCVNDTSFILVNRPNPIPFVENDTICEGDLAVTFDAGNYDLFNWSTQDSTQTINLDSAGRYTIEVTDSNGCVSDTSFELVVNPKPIPFISNDTICEGGGPVVFDAGSYTSFLWSTNDTTQTIQLDASGVYTVEVMDDNGCISDTSFELIVNVLPIPYVANDTICEGDSIVEFSVGDYDIYDWNGNNNDSVFSSKDGGVYTVEVTDSNGCKADTSFELIVNLLPIPYVPNDTICDGDSPVTLDAGVYLSYNWQNGLSVDQLLSTNAGNSYHIEVTDSNGCVNDTTVELVVNPNPIVSIGPDEEICSMDPAVQLTTGFTKATYLWSNDSTTSSIQIHDEGDYSLILTDSNGCLGYDTMYLKVNQMPLVNMQDQVICAGDSEVIFDAGLGFETYIWNTGDTISSFQTNQAGEYTVDFIDAQGCPGSDTVVLVVNPLPTPDLGLDITICENASSVAFTPGTYAKYEWFNYSDKDSYNTTRPGIYDVEVTDSNGCVAQDTVELIVIPLPKPDVIFDVAMCPGMKATLDASGFDNGNGPYTYEWHDRSKYSTYIAAYKEWTWVDITDAYGCVGRDSAEITIEQNLSVTIANAPKIDLCIGENVDLIPNYKSVDNYNFTWSTNETTDVINVDTSGLYIVHVDDGKGCEGDAIVEVEVHPLPIVTPSKAAICNGDSVVIGNDKGNQFDYVWSTAEQTAQITVFTGGIFDQEVTNVATGCKNSTFVEVILNDNPNPDLGPDIKVCDGTLVNVSDIGGDQNLSYLWSTTDTVSQITATGSNDYILNVETPEGCVGKDTVNVIFVPIPVVDLGPDINLCEGETGTIDAGISGLNYTWNDSQTETVFDVNQTNTHIISVSNELCSSTDTINVNVVPLPTSGIDHSLDNKYFCFEELTDRGFNISAGTDQSYDYLWGTTDSTSDITIQSAGTYVVQISVGNCFITDRITFNEFCPSALYIPNTFSPNGDGINDSFNAKGHNITDYHMYIFNRWGQQIYESESMFVDWDGTYMGREVQIDTYVYKIYYSMNHPDGKPRRKQKVGHVNVLR